MQRWLSIVVGAAAVGLVAVLTWKSLGAKPLPAVDAGAPDAGERAALDAQAAGTFPELGDGGMFLSDLQVPAGTELRDGGRGLPDGRRDARAAFA